MVKHNNAPKPSWLTRLTPPSWRRRWERWISRRLPAQKQVTLSHKGIFILPSGFGLAWLGLVVVLYLFGTNYQNNLIIGLSLVLASVFHTCIIYSYKNLAGLTFSALTPPEGVAGDTMPMPIKLSGQTDKHHTNTTHQQICLNFAHQRHIRVHHSGELTDATIPFDNPARGLLRPGRITVSSYFPLGLCRAWSYVDLDLQHIIYAKPQPSEIQLTSVASQDATNEQHGKLRPGVDDFKGLTPYIDGESLKQVAWKQWAQGKGMFTKVFAEPEGAPVWLSYQRHSAESVESQLSHLAWQVDSLSRKQQMFGLSLLHYAIEPNNGDAHRKACQIALATFALSSNTHPDSHSCSANLGGKNEG
ncbi:DUF58 domain-containing protein [Shewanella intestini]|uniref:DUF58 domain-containing protein n=1 Tax=Shewanella intestini TaxID=2017544 RepID=A0ABS5I5D0_9GAMM|nr:MULTISPECIES: DUF58 domain-containing protein [Shewanella]MBR9729233.1 DUF58 domain-containing protein [Shewanella intestini]MRG35378.1 DUF58 domain-containing protein [Shewanella sp. XMDDZSB0408]